MSDPANEETEAIIKEIEARLHELYSEAIEGIEAKLDDYMKRFYKKDATWRAWVEDVKDSDPEEYEKRLSEYQKWRIGQIAVGQRWKEMKETLAEDLANTNESAKAIAAGRVPDVYALNHDYGTFQVEIGSGLDTNYTLYDRNVIARILKDNPDILPSPGKKLAEDIARGEAIKWNRQQIQSVMMQALIQGESIPKIATRLANEVGDKNRKAAIRNARTMMTGTQNAGRVDSYKRAVDMGIDMKQQWLATHDMRTRHEHRLLDYQEVTVGEPFIVPDTGEEIMYPGDPNAAPRLIYNCRCTLRGVVAGLEPQARKFRDLSDIGGDYETWRNSKKKPESNPITLPEEKGEAIKRAYIAEYRRKAASVRRGKNERD